jgi:hypothetical protein
MIRQATKEPQALSVRGLCRRLGVSRATDDRPQRARPESPEKRALRDRIQVLA